MFQNPHNGDIIAIMHFFYIPFTKYLPPISRLHTNAKPNRTKCGKIYNYANINTFFFAQFANYIWWIFVKFALQLQITTIYFTFHSLLTFWVAGLFGGRCCCATHSAAVVTARNSFRWCRIRCPTALPSVHPRHW